MNRNTLLAAVAALSLVSHAAVPVRWSADTFKVKPLAYECYHGETLDLAASLTAYGEPLALGGKTVHLFWQTNGMDEAVWFQANGEVRVDPASGATNVLAATWSGANDGGADKVIGFIGVDGENYRASFELRLRYSPGFVPNQIPFPVKVIDCEKVTWLHPEAAPFSGGGTLPGQVTNIAAYVVQRDVPSWARESNPPEGMTQNAVIISNELAYTKSGTNVTAAMVGALPADTPIPALPTAWALSAVTNAQGGAVGAADVGARADTWMPSADDVGALPVTGGTITNATLSSPSVLRIGNNGIEKPEEVRGGDGYVGELHIGGNGASGMYYPGDGGTGKIYIGGFGYGQGNGEVYIGADNEYGGSGKLVVGGDGYYYDGQGEIIVRGNDQYAATVTIGDADNGGVLTVGGSDVITANTTNSFAQGIVSVAMSATTSYLTQTNITELTPYGADSIVGKIHSAPSPAGAAVAKSTIEYNASGTACIVTIAAGGQLAATTTGWPNGQATTAIITIGAGATIADNISLVGYGSWPVGEAFIASCVYYNSKVRVVPIQKVQ